MAARTSHVVLVATASLALGVFLGIMLSGGMTEIAAGATPAFAATSDAAQRVDLLTLPATSAHATSFEPRVSAVSAARDTELPEAPAPEFDGAVGESSAVTGSIATIEGVPIAGVELELEPPKEAPKYRVRRATSDASGRFEFPHLTRGVWRITGRHRQYVLQRRTSFPQLVPTGMHVEFVACPGVPVDVRVTGEECARARVAFRRAGGGEPEWSPWTSENTLLALSPGSWELCASVDALEDWPSDRNWKLARLASPVTVVHVGGSDAAFVTLALEPARCLYGRVRLREGTQFGDEDDSLPAVRLTETLAGTTADFESEGDRLSRSTQIDQEGRYGFFALPSARWTAGIAINWESPTFVQVVDVAGLTPLDLEETSEDEGSVLVDAFTAGGDRITTGISFNFLHRDTQDEPDEYLWQGARTVLAEGGAIRVIAVPMQKNYREKAEKKHELVLRATLPGFARIEQTIAGLIGERVRLTFVPGASLEVLLVGDGAERAMRKCNAQIVSPGYQSRAVFDETLRALKFDGLNAGTYTLTVSAWGSDEAGQWRMVQLHKGETVVRVGPQRITIQLPTRSELVVRCPGVKKDVNASLQGPLLEPTADRDEYWWNPHASAKVDGSGQVKFERVVAGRYRLSIGQRMQEITVPCAPVEFAGRIPERHRFRIKKGDSPLRRIGLRSGDILVALDGDSLSADAARTRMRALSSQSAGTLRLTVERDGRTHDLVLDASTLGEDESFDATTEPVLD